MFSNSQPQNQRYNYSGQDNYNNLSGLNSYSQTMNDSNPMPYGQINTNPQIPNQYFPQNNIQNMPLNAQQIAQQSNYQPIQPAQQNYNLPNFTANSNPQFYANGGQVKSRNCYSQGGILKKYAQKIQKKGRNGDTILAHINPQEAAMLKSVGGSGSINPKTGLKEYGFLKKLARIAVPVLGTIFGGPAGAIGASALLGASERGKGNKLKGLLHGAGRGAIYSALAPMAGNAFGVNPSGMFGRMAGMNSGSFLSQLGLAGAPGSGGGLGLWGNGAGNVGAISNYMNGGMGSVINGIGPVSSSIPGLPGSSGSQMVVSGNSAPGFGGLMQNALMATAIGGSLLRREKPQKQESLSEYLLNNKVPEDPRYKAGEIKKIRRVYIPEPAGYNAGVDPEHLYYREEAYKDGGYLEGDTDGQADAVLAQLGSEPIRVGHGEFITKAPVVSIVGGGNSNAGGRVFENLQDSIMKIGAKHGGHLPKGKSLQTILGEIMIKEGKRRAVRN